MKAFGEIVRTSGGSALLLLAFFLLIGQLSALLQALRMRREKGAVCLAVLQVLLGFTLLVLLLDGIFMAGMYRPLPRESWPAAVHAVYALPWGVIAGIELAFALTLALFAQSIRRYTRSHLTPDAVKETLDLLPEGVCVSRPDGTVLLSNLRMSELCRALTGALLSDAGRFWAYIEQNGEKQGETYLLRAPDNAVWQFAHRRLSENGLSFEQITASNMTDIYRITEELSSKNAQLRTVQYRMKAVSARASALRVPREIMQARRAVHDHMGNVLLTGKNYLDHPEALDEESLLRLLRFNSHFLLGEAEQPEKPADPIREALELTSHTGVTVEIDGELPAGTTPRLLLAQAMEQSAANAVRHAGGDRLFVTLRETDGILTASFRNNGAKPQKRIVETGGLAALRESVEAAGGAMTVESTPAFVLTLNIPTH